MAFVYRLEKTSTEEIMKVIKRNAKTLGYQLIFPESNENQNSINISDKELPADLKLNISEETIWTEYKEMPKPWEFLKLLKSINKGRKLESYTKNLLKGLDIKSFGYASGGGD